MSPENKKEAPQTNLQDKYKNIHKNIITENCGFVKGLERTRQGSILRSHSTTVQAPARPAAVIPKLSTSRNSRRQQARPTLSLRTSPKRYRR